MDAAAALNKPFHFGTMNHREKPLYRVGTARTTKGFHESLEERKQLHDRVYATSDQNNNNNSDDRDTAEAEKMAEGNYIPDITDSSKSTFSCDMKIQ